MALTYKLKQAPRALDSTLCGNNRSFDCGNILFTPCGQRVELGVELAAGGEGSVFCAKSAGTPGPLIAKLYHPNQRTRWREQKLSLMCARPVRSPCVAWPSALLYDELRRFAGVLMPRAAGVPLAGFALHPGLLRRQFPEWTRYELVKLACNLALSVHELHGYGVILGDLHPGNVMVDADGSVCWVDADSFQVEDYPCAVGTPRFRAPELHGRYGDCLRTRSHDAYALSVLLFMVQAMGLSPFAYQGAEPGREGDPTRFPYAFGDYRPPHGLYPPDTYGRYVWSYMPARLRAAQGHNLTYRPSGNGLHPRVLPEVLARCFEQYLTEMEPGGCRSHPLYRELLPDRPCPPRAALAGYRPQYCTDCGKRFWESPEDAARRGQTYDGRTRCKFCIRRRSALAKAS